MEDEKEMSIAEYQLLECAKKRRHVFLYGKNSMGRTSMVENISKEIFSKHKYVNCQNMDGKDVYYKLTNLLIGLLISNDGSLFVDNLSIDPNDNEDFIYYKKLAKDIKEWETETHESKDDEDNEEWIIERPRELIGSPYVPFNVQWLVVYSKEPNNFPDYFTRQFTMISLESESDAVKTIEVDSIRKLLKFNKKEVELEPKQIQLYELLYEHKDEVVE